MKAFLVFAILTIGAASAFPDHHPGHHGPEDFHKHGAKPYNVCLKSVNTDQNTCTELKSAVKEIIGKLQAKRSQFIEKLQTQVLAGTAPSPNSPEVEDNLPAYLTKLQNLFNISSQTDCHFEACKCKSGELKCMPMLALLKSPLEKAKLPECLNESEKAREILTELKGAIKDGDRQTIVDILDRLREAVVNKLAKGDEGEDDKLYTCLRSTVKEIKSVMKAKLTKLHLQPNCDFCDEKIDVEVKKGEIDENNKLRQVDIDQVNIPVPEKVDIDQANIPVAVPAIIQEPEQVQ